MKKSASANAVGRKFLFLISVSILVTGLAVLLTGWWRYGRDSDASRDPAVSPTRAEHAAARNDAAKSLAPSGSVSQSVPPATGTNQPQTIKRLELKPLEQREWVPLIASTAPGQVVEPSITRTASGFKIVIDVPGFERIPVTVAGESYERWEIPGWSRMATPGLPSVPQKDIMLEIPHNVTASVRLLSRIEVTAAPVAMIPGQPPIPDVYPAPPPPPFEKNRQVYGSNDLFPSNHIVDCSVEGMRNRRILTVGVVPVCVRPAGFEATIATHMELEIVFSDDATGKDVSIRDGSGDLVWESEPDKEGEPLSDGASSGTASKYMILMDDQFTNNARLAEFVEWKRQKGYDVTTVKTSDIDPGGAPTNGQIISYMRNLPAADYPEYLLIIGDHTPTNGVQGTFFLTDEGGWSDLYIACRNGSDYLPDLYHGRLPAVDNRRLSNMVDSVLLMDRDVPANNIYQRVCVAGQIQDSNNNDDVADRLFCETMDLIACYFEQDSGGVDYICERAMVNPDDVTSNCFWNDDSILWNSTNRIGTRVFQHFVSVEAARGQIISNINNGVAILQHRDHGWGDGSGWGDPDFRTSHVNALTNGNRKTLVFSINCASGAYHKNGFLRAWLQNTNGGAYAVFAPVDISYSWYNDWLTHGLYAGFLTNYLSFQNASTNPDWPRHLSAPGGSYGAAGSATRLGQMLNFSKMYLREKYSTSSEREDTFRLFHVFGDPEAFPQLLEPTNQPVRHVSSIHVRQTSRVVVSNLLENSMVCLYSRPLGVQAVTNSTSDSVALDVTPCSNSTIDVTVTRFGMRPYHGTIAVTGVLFRFETTQYDCREDTGTVQVVVRRCGDTNTTESVVYTTGNGTALAGSDYTATSNKLTFGPGVVSKSFTIPIADDANDEGYETIQVQLSNASGESVIGSPSNAVVRIEDNDGAGVLVLPWATDTVGESAGRKTVVVQRINGDDGAVSVAFATSNGSAVAGVDYKATNGVLSFAAGVLTNRVEIEIISNLQDYPDKTINLRLSNPTGGAVLGAPSNSVLTILDDDTGGSLALNASAYTTSERSASIRVWVMRSNGSDGDVSIGFTTKNGTALAGTHYTATNGTLALSHHVTSNYFDIALNSHAGGPMDRNFSVIVSNACGGAELGRPTNATITILDSTVYLKDGFEGGRMPPGWSQEYVTNTADWAFQKGGRGGGSNPSTAHSGNYNACLYFASTDHHKTKLISPALDFGTQTNDIELTFWHCMTLWSPDQDELRMFYRTSEEGDWNLLATYTNNVSSWTQRTIALSNLTSTFYLAFEGDAKYGSGVCIDDVMVRCARKLTVLSERGGTRPGTVTTNYGWSFSEYITNSPNLNGISTQYVCVGGTVLSNDYTKISATNVSLTLTNDALLRWQWTTNYYLTLNVSGAGSVDRTNAWFGRGSNVTIEATADAEWFFTGWSSGTNGCTTNGNQITAQMTQARSITAAFAPLRPTLTAVSAFGGANPTTATVDWGESIHCYLTNSPVTGVKTQYVANGGTVLSNTFTVVNGTNITLSLKNNATLVWNWRTNYWLAAAVNGRGSIDWTNNWAGSGSNVIITATPSNDCRFAFWSGDTDNCTIDSNEITVPVTGPLSVVANFLTDGQHMLQIASPYGTATPAVGFHVNDAGKVLTNRVSGLDTRGTTQYVCSGWAMSGNAPLSGATTSCVMTVTNDAALTWQWTTNYYLALSVGGSGSLDRASGWMKEGSNVTVTATPMNHYHFASWSGNTNGCVITSNRIVMAMTTPRSITANFVTNDQRRLQIVSAHGTAAPAVGFHVNDVGTVLTNRVSGLDTRGTTQYVCSGWVMSGNAPLSGTTTSCVMTVTNDAVLTWQWTTNYYLTLSANGSGTLNRASGWMKEGSNVTVTATPMSHYRFVSWSGNTGNCSIVGNIITAAMTQARSVTGIFEAILATNGTPEPWLVRYGLTNSTPNEEELKDTDDDNMSAWEEYVADTDPTNKASTLSVVDMSFTGNDLRIDWTGGRASTQYLQSRLSLGDTGEVWVSIFTNLPPTPVATNLVISGGATNSGRFYRIKAER